MQARKVYPPGAKGISSSPKWHSQVSDMTTYRLLCNIARENRDAAEGICYLHGAVGTEELPCSGSDALVCVYFENATAAENARAQLETIKLCSGAGIETIEEQDWNAKWRAQMKPAKLTKNMWVSPAWLAPPRSPGDHWIQIEPKMAFGTGHHETTRLAARALTALGDYVHRKTFLDIGTGSGVLSFVADWRGASLSVGIEIDSACRENIAENRMANPAKGAIKFCIGTVECTVQCQHFDIIVMNMIRTHSEPLLPACRIRLKPRGRLIWSGILVEESESVIKSAAQEGFDCIAQTAENEWWCGVFEKH
jgi:ribosomal protein L11 methyltransferase